MKPTKLHVYDREAAHKQVLREFKDVAARLKETKAIAFGFCMVMPDNSISTFYCNQGGNLHTLNGAAHTLAGRINNDTI